MSRFFSLLLLALVVALGRPAAAEGVPPRPVPFTFVTDQANLLSAADAKKLDGGLRKYAESTGTQVVVVTVPSLNGTGAAAYARQIGTSWGVGQRGKDNGIVVLLSGQDHQMSIEAGSGLRSAITPELTKRVMGQDMAPAFKQGNYFAGLRKGLNTLMLAANPSSDPRKNGAAATSAAATTTSTDDAAGTPSAMSATSPDEPAAASPTAPAESASPGLLGGLGLGSLLIGALVIGGGIWLLKRLFSRGSGNAATQSATPDFRGAGPAAGNQAPNFMGNQGYPQGGNYGGPAPSSGSGMGGILATGAAAAAGAYLGNRMAEGHDTASGAPHNFDAGNAGAAGAVPPANAASDYFGTSHGSADTAGPDYFSDTTSADNSGDYFSGDNSSYDDTSSDDTGGGGFDSTDDNQGSW